MTSYYYYFLSFIDFSLRKRARIDRTAKTVVHKNGKLRRIMLSLFFPTLFWCFGKITQTKRSSPGHISVSHSYISLDMQSPKVQGHWVKSQSCIHHFLTFKCYAFTKTCIVSGSIPWICWWDHN